MKATGIQSERTAGFTLLETIVAFVIISVSLAMAVRTVSFSVHNAERSRIEAQLRDIARTVLLEKSGQIKSGREESGNHGQNYTWHLSVDPIQVEAAQDIRIVTLRIQHRALPKLSTTYIGFSEGD